MKTAVAHLCAENISKSFGGLKALESISLDFRGGEIHAVLGENGAGKSTLMNVLAGFLTPDQGTVKLNGRELPLGQAFQAKRLGIEMIHQHFTLVPEFTVAENLALAHLPSLTSGVNPRDSAADAQKIARDLDWEINPDAKIATLPVGVQQRVEILKALGGEGSVLIFDEPTAVLSQEEVEDLFRVMRRLRDEGRIVLLIAHKLSEVLAVADTISVLRRGKLVGTGPRSEFDEKSLSTLMVGVLPDLRVHDRAAPGSAGVEVRDLRVKGDRGELAVRGSSFAVARGEILGLGGVDGNGQVELAEALVGVRPISGGEVLWQGAPISYDDVKVGYVPQDRHGDGLALEMSVADNLLITGHRRPALSSGPMLRLREAVVWAASVIQRFSIKAHGPNAKTRSLSGGNQQKVVVGRTLDESPELLVVVNPTRGLDFRATEFVHNALRRAATDGTAVVLFTTDLDELAAVADRQLFLNRGVASRSDDAIVTAGNP
jgi:simple sugar transport system ATP-binding protein